jgi:metal-responsive CopG/Arc/MetJ family transcriptional regulator
MKIFGTKVMESISLKVPEDLLGSSDRYARALGIPRAEYIRRAIERMNREAETRIRAERMARVSLRVRKESMRVNSDFAALERDPDD